MATGSLIRPLWRQRTVLCAALALILLIMTTHRGAAGLHGAGLRISIALGITAACWLAWVLIGPKGDTPVLRALTAGTAVSGSILLLLYPALTVYWFTFWACFSAGANFSQRIGAAITGASAVILIAGYADKRIGLLLAFAAVALVAYVLGRNRKQYLGLARQATLSADVREHAATIAERGRIARELHDVLGHSLTGVSLEIESAAAALETTADASRALSHLEHAGELVRTGQLEAVEAVRTLRTADLALHSMVADLTSSLTAAGVRVNVVITGTPRTLDAAPALALYRAVQEALTNAAKHAPGQAVTVDLGYAADRVLLRVVNDIQPAAGGSEVSGGYGLAGMRERMAAAGGTLQAGQVGEQWRIEASVSA